VTSPATDDGQDRDDENDTEATATIDVDGHVGSPASGDRLRWPMIGRPTSA
jgi:hypothetical protein